MEIVERRGYNRKVFKDGDKQLKFVFRTQHCHYRDPLSLEFLEIDTTMYFDEATRTFRQFKASYHSDIPEYADEVIGFRNLYESQDHTVEARPICSHIKGTLHNTSNEGNYVEYKDAFSKGIDLRVYAYAHGLKEVIVINELPNPNNKDLTFDFELLNTEKYDFAERKTLNDKWNKKDRLTFKSKNINLSVKNRNILDGRTKGSFFRVAQVWDSNFLIQPVDIELYEQDDKLFLRKTVTKVFMKKAVFPVYTDHATSYYAGSGDGYVDARKFIDFTSAWGQSNWDYIHDTNHSSEDFEGSVANYTGSFIENGPYVSSGEIRLQRAFIPIDTSGIDDSYNVTVATLYLWCAQKYDNQNDSYGYIAVVNTTPASNTTLALTDFDNCGDAINNPTKGSSDIDITGIDSSDTVYTQISLNATGLTWISKTGYSQLGLRQGMDIQDRVPDNGNNGERAIFRSSETTSTDKDPYIEITAVSADVTFNSTANYKKGIVIT